MPIADHFTSVFSREWEINFTQCTPNGYLKYTDLCNILQLTAGSHSEVGGISFTDMQEFNQAWVLSRMRVEISRLPKWRDLVTVKTWIVSLENSRSVRALEMHINGEKVVGSETFWAVFNTKTRRPEALALPNEHFEKFPETFSTKERVKKVAFSEMSEVRAARTVVVSDLDIVNHVNNVKYLEWCLDLVPAEWILKSKIVHFDLNFMKELMLSDQVSILEKDHTYAILKDGKGCFALELGLRS